MRRFTLRCGGLMLIAAVASAVPAAVSASDLAPQTSRDRGVTVRAKPVDVSPEARTWTFEIVLDTHSVELTDDVQRAATLSAPGGQPQGATAWEGDPPGGHHRKGVLRFAPLAPRPEVLVLRIQRPGESVPRDFRWSLTDRHERSR